jgi:hypothetical protein
METLGNNSWKPLGIIHGNLGTIHGNFDETLMKLSWNFNKSSM